MSRDRPAPVGRRRAPSPRSRHVAATPLISARAPRRSVAPSAFAGYSFHVAEAALVFANEVLVCFLFPIHAGVHRAYHLATTAIHIGAARGRPRSAGGRAWDESLGLQRAPCAGAGRAGYREEGVQGAAALCSALGVCVLGRCCMKTQCTLHSCGQFGSEPPAKAAVTAGACSSLRQPAHEVQSKGREGPQRLTNRRRAPGGHAGYEIAPFIPSLEAGAALLCAAARRCVAAMQHEVQELVSGAAQACKEGGHAGSGGGSNRAARAQPRGGGGRGAAGGVYRVLKAAGAAGAPCAALNTVRHHDMHHRFPTRHFSLYFTHWDRWCGTEHPGYARAVRCLLSQCPTSTPCFETVRTVMRHEAMSCGAGMLLAHCLFLYHGSWYAALRGFCMVQNLLAQTACVLRCGAVERSQT